MNSFKRLHGSFFECYSLKERVAMVGGLVAVGWTRYGSVEWVHVCTTNTDEDKAALVRMAEEWLESFPDDCASVYEVLDNWHGGLELAKHAVWERLSLNDTDLEDCVRHHANDKDHQTVDSLVNLVEQLVSRVKYLEEKVNALETK